MCAKIYIDMNIPVYYDPHIGTRGQGYNLGDILNMPAFWAHWTLFRSHHDLSVVASQLPQSIAGLYYNCRSDGLGDVADDPIIPYRPRLLCAVNESIAVQPEIQPILQMVQDDSVLCVHVRSGDYGPMTDDFLRTLAHLSKQYPKIIVLSGVHCNGDNQFIAQNKAKLNQCLDKIRTIIPHAMFDFNHPDVHVCCMARARNLLLHTGSFSILGSLVFSGKNLYVTSAFQPFIKRKNTKLWHDLNIPHQVITPPGVIDMHFNNNVMPTIKSVMPSRVAATPMPTMKSVMPSRVAATPMPTMKSVIMPSRVAMPMPIMNVNPASFLTANIIPSRKTLRPMRMNMQVNRVN